MAKKSKSGSTLVGVKLRSPFKDDYNYYQDLVMNYPHRNLDELKHDLPITIKHFAAAVSLRPQLQTKETAVGNHFSLFRNIDNCVETLIAYVNSRLDFLNLWQRRVLCRISDVAIVPIDDSEDDASPEQ